LYTFLTCSFADQYILANKNASGGCDPRLKNMTVHGSLHQARKVEKVEKSRKFEADAFVLFPEK